jgi:hypothetical protein
MNEVMMLTVRPVYELRLVSYRVSDVWQVCNKQG